MITAAEESSSPPRGKLEEGRGIRERDAGGGGSKETVAFSGLYAAAVKASDKVKS